MKLCAARAVAPRDPVAVVITRRVDVDTGTLENNAGCELPPDLDAIRRLAPRDAGACAIIRRVDLDVLGVGDGEACKSLPDWDLDPCLLCAFFVGSTVLSIPSSNGTGRGISRGVPPESSCVTSRTGTNAPFPWTASCICVACLSRNCGAAPGCLFVKKRSGRPPLVIDIENDIDDGLAGRFVAERASRVGTMGRFPVMMRASRKARRLAVRDAERPVPKRSAGTTEIALRIRTSTAASATLENWLSSRSGATTPTPGLSFVILVASVTLTLILPTFDCEPSRPYQG